MAKNQYNAHDYDLPEKFYKHFLCLRRWLKVGKHQGSCFLQVRNVQCQMHCASSNEGSIFQA